jgi:aspartate aminotransferase
MNSPAQLARPLASRVALLPEVTAPIPADQPVPESVQQAAFEAMARGETHYTDRPGILPLRKQAVEWLGKYYGLELSADEVTITCGATEARFVALKQLAGGKRVLALSGGVIEPAARLLGIALTQQADNAASIGLVYLTPADDPDQVRAVLEGAASTDWWIIWDTSAGPAQGFHPVQHPALAGRVVSIGSFSDALPGWRVGWMAGSKAANKLRAYKQSMTICSTSISQWAALGLADS